MNIPSFQLDGKVALVTGGSKGIGFGMAQALGHYGAKLVITSRGVEEGENAVAQLKEENIEAVYFPCDVTKKDQVEQLVAKVVDHYGSLDILVNNAGMNIRKPLVEVEESDWDQVLTVNLKGLFLIGQACSKQMIKQNYGKIINISSILGTVGMQFQTSYAASKGGINQLTKVWAEELAPHNITVNSIGPGYIKTPMTKEWLSDPERTEWIINSTMSKRIGETSDLVGPVVFLASDTSAYVTGQILNVDGGWTAR
ncbi:glucose 1-dehydrogenase [Mesobacillus maritimus]|uniref:SDR family NAD(P)-dependent oxidoreductase n=1 Tax=Mesobacillus maritimus TaxID=1643336 RepID=UPI00203F5330|nr:glucose 1-dehydrogenase [Mesobacillus maritimus]MCM3584817.1 glucose 1-dehydrogenase [Mesobacillus maritimus]MCM3671230.1 glucose 1-dehydrogenase [Mesobacillus maritimus]